MVKPILIQYFFPVSFNKIESIFTFNFFKYKTIKGRHLIHIKFGKIKNMETSTRN